MTGSRGSTADGLLRYRAQIVWGAEATERGLVYQQAGTRPLLPWSRVRRAFAAEVGEPEGVRTIVFDLVIAVDGEECVALRFDVDPGPEARSMARAIQLGVGAELCDASLQSLVAEGLLHCTHPDLRPFDEACLESLRRKPFE